MLPSALHIWYVVINTKVYFRSTKRFRVCRFWVVSIILCSRVNCRHILTMLSIVYLQRTKLFKTPIPVHFQPWKVLSETERKNALKILQVSWWYRETLTYMLNPIQDHDKEKTAIYTVAKAGKGANEKYIRKDLFDSLPVVDRWRAWHTMLTREREGHFRRLQVSLY